jgi:5-methylcytosine-specific restriction endonuclease McrA
MKRKPIPKKIREQVYNKYGGHCAYCGCPLEYKDMQVDHIESVYTSSLLKKEVNDSIENYMPSCRMCNFYKSTSTIEQFRNNLKNMLMRNVRLPFDYRLALKYGLIKEDIKPIIFYFEKGISNDEI